MAQWLQRSTIPTILLYNKLVPQSFEILIYLLPHKLQLNMVSYTNSIDYSYLQFQKLHLKMPNILILRLFRRLYCTKCGITALKIDTCSLKLVLAKSASLQEFSFCDALS